MKKYNLDETWRLCLKMWKWVVKEWKKDKELIAPDLKYIWLKRNGFNANRITCGCFFCDYAIQHKQGSSDNRCPQCPASLLDPDFDCIHPIYDYCDYPDKFYAKLLELNKKRKAKK